MPGDAVRIRRALISVSDKTGLKTLVQALETFGVEIISTGGTAKAIEAMGVAVTPVEAVTGFPEVLGGRVKTLHPAIHAAILGDRDNPEHMADLKKHGIEPIDLVVVNLYPFEETAAKAGVTEEELIEQIDIGGVALLRAAAKNHEHVAVVQGSRQYEALADALRELDGCVGRGDRYGWACEAFVTTSRYDRCIVGAIEQFEPDGMSDRDSHDGSLRYGENPHQKADVIARRVRELPSVVPFFDGARQRSGKALSYNNLNDASGAASLAFDLSRLRADSPSAVVVKHTNPCGVAVAPTIGAAVRAAIAGDPRAAYGGILATMFEIDETAARIIREASFFEVIAAAAFSEEALSMLSEKWPNVRLLDRITPLQGLRSDEDVRELCVSHRTILGGKLEQEIDLEVPASDAPSLGWEHAAGPAIAEATLHACGVVWLCAKHLTSNAIAIGGPDPDEDAAGGDGPSAVRLFGGGCGQQDRVWACRIAAEKAGESIERAQGRGLPVIAASDAFFPFPDGPELLIEAGVSVIVHPGGSKRDEETLDLCDRRGVTCLTTGRRHFRH